MKQSLVYAKKLKSRKAKLFGTLVETIGIEPMTSCMSSMHSNQLSYASTTKVLYHKLHVKSIPFLKNINFLLIYTAGLSPMRGCMGSGDNKVNNCYLMNVPRAEGQICPRFCDTQKQAKQGNVAKRCFLTL